MTTQCKYSSLSSVVKLLIVVLIYLLIHSFIYSELVCKYNRTPSVRCRCRAIVVNGVCAIQPRNVHICTPNPHDIEHALFENALLEAVMNNPIETPIRIYKQVASL